MGLMAGKLDRRITLERFVISSIDMGSGEQIKTWVTLGPPQIWASRRRASANEVLAAAEISATISDVFEIRWDGAWSEVDPTCRLICEGVTYDIVAVDEIGRRVGLRIAANARAER